MIRGKPVEEALNILNFTPRRAAHQLAKTVKSAAANAIAVAGTSKIKAEELQITKIFVDGAPTAKRIQFRSMGRVYRIRKRFCHITVEVEGELEEEEPRKTRRSRKEKAPARDKKKSKPAKGKKAKAAEAEEETAGKEKTAPVDESPDGEETAPEADIDKSEGSPDAGADKGGPEDDTAGGGDSGDEEARSDKE